jgi:hypothetical protein
MQAQTIRSLGEYVSLIGIVQERGIKYITIRKHIERHNIPTIKLGNNILVRRTDIESYTPQKRNYNK